MRRAEELAKDGAMLDGDDMAQLRASTEVYAALQLQPVKCHDCGELKPKLQESWFS